MDALAHGPRHKKGPPATSSREWGLEGEQPQGLGFGILPCRSFYLVISSSLSTHHFWALKS